MRKPLLIMVSCRDNIWTLSVSMGVFLPHAVTHKMSKPKINFWALGPPTRRLDCKEQNGRRSDRVAVRRFQVGNGKEWVLCCVLGIGFLLEKWWVSNSVPSCLKPFKELSPPCYLSNFTIYIEVRVDQTRHLLNCKEYLHSEGMNLE